MGARSHRAALAQHVERDAMALDRRRNPAIERDQQQDVANLIRRAAVGQRAVDVDAKLVGAPDRRRHGDRGQRLGLGRQRGTAPALIMFCSGSPNAPNALVRCSTASRPNISRRSFNPLSCRSRVSIALSLSLSLSPPLSLPPSPLTTPPAFRPFRQARSPAEPRPIPWR